MIFIWHTAVYRAHRGTLWFFVKTFTFRTFICNYKIIIIANWFLRGICIHGKTG